MHSPKTVLLGILLAFFSVQAVGADCDSCTGVYDQQVHDMYVAYYGRPADPGGLAYWSERIGIAGGSLDSIIDEFGNSAEANTLYKSLGTEGAVTALYNRLFGRAPDADGLSFYVNNINDGTYSLVTVAANIFYGASAESEDGKGLNNKVTLAKAFTQELQLDPARTGWYSGEVAAGIARDAVAAVNDDADSLDSASENIPDLLSTMEVAASYGDLVSVPTDVAALSYPGSYSRRPADSGEVVTDRCRTDIDWVSYQKSWLGELELPAAENAPLPWAVQRGIYLKDIMQFGNPTFNPNCTGDLYAEFRRTMRKLRQLGVDTVGFTQWHWASKRTDGSWYILDAERSTGPISDADVTALVQSAHDEGLRVYTWNQIQGFTDSTIDGEALYYRPDSSPENHEQWFNAFEEMVLERAVFFESLGLDLWEFGCSVCLYGDNGNSSESAEYFQSRYETIAGKVKPLYSGEFVASSSSWLQDSAPVLDLVSHILAPLWHKEINSTEGFSPAVMKQAIVDGGAAASIELLDTLGKSLIFEFQAQSRANLFELTGHLEETGCTAGIGDLNISSSCIQRETSPDFSLQANIYQGYLEYLSELELQSPSTVFAGDYWSTDSIISTSVFPNIGATIRGKPAEGLLMEWFRRE